MKRIRTTLIAMLLIALIVPNTSSAADKYGIGFNENWVMGYLKYLGKYCYQCPTNTVAADYNVISSIIYDQIANQHVGTYREIISVPLLQPQNYNDIIAIMSIYSAYNLQVVLTMGLPIPYDMATSGDTYRIMPGDDPSWETLKNSLSFTMGNFINALWNSPSINRQWLSTRLFIEGFNEFDGILNTSNSTYSSTPLRAAQLQNGIQTVLNQYGIPVVTLMPSVVGNFPYPPGVSPRGQFIADYYANGGTGAPNIHLYAPTNSPFTSYINVVDAIRAEVNNVTQYLPPNLRGQLVIGETGNADVHPPYCNENNGNYGPSIAPDQRQYEYAAIAADPSINANVRMIIFWRLMQFDPQQFTPQELQTVIGCEPYYGVVTYPYGSPFYNAVGTNLFNYLRQ